MFESLLCFLNEVPSWLNQEHCALLFLSSFSLSISLSLILPQRVLLLIDKSDFCGTFFTIWRMFIKHELVVKDHETMHKCLGLGGWKMGILWPTSTWLIYCRGFLGSNVCFVFVFEGVEGVERRFTSSPLPPASLPWFRLT